jgi:opacity protein-like surface antigen
MYLLRYILSVLVVVCLSAKSFAGNPDRQGEAGAYELLMNPWAPSAGLHTINTASISGVEAMRLNPAGLVRVDKLQVMLGHANYMQGTDIRLNAIGLSRKVGGNGAFGLSIMAVDFGEIQVTTDDQPEGTGATYSPNFFNIGLSYSHIFENKVSVGITVRGVSQSLSDIAAFGLAIDAGIQYVTGPQDNFKIGISLRNVGSPMKFGGEGLSEQRPSPNRGSYELTYNQRAAEFSMPSMLNLGVAYDLYPFEHHRVSLMGNFTSHSFSRDQLGAGVEYSLRDLFKLRAAYKYDMGSEEDAAQPLYSGLSAGASIDFPLSRENKSTKVGIDYAYRATRIYNGTHNISLRFSL